MLKGHVIGRYAAGLNYATGQGHLFGFGYEFRQDVGKPGSHFLTTLIQFQIWGPRKREKPEKAEAPGITENVSRFSKRQRCSLPAGSLEPGIGLKIATSLGAFPSVPLSTKGGVRVAPDRRRPETPGARLRPTRRLDENGLTMREIASEMGVSAAFVCKTLKARQRLPVPAGVV